MDKTIEITLSEEQLERWLTEANINNLDLEHWIYEACNRYLTTPKLLVHENKQSSPDWICGLSARASMCLLSAGYKNKEDVILKLAQKKDRDFLQIPNLGKGTLKEIKNWAHSNSEHLNIKHSKTIKYLYYLK